MGSISTKLKSDLHRTFKNLLSFCNLRVTFKIPSRLNNFFTFKDKVNKEIHSLLVYNYKCSSCNAVYIGKTKRHYKTWISEHIGVSALTGKTVKSHSQTSSVRHHMLLCNTVVSSENFTIIASSNSNFRLEIQESILIKFLKPELNKNVTSVPVYLFE